MPSDVEQAIRPIVRSVCLAVRELTPESMARLDHLVGLLEASDMTVQTRRVLSPGPIARFRDVFTAHETYFSIGQVSLAGLADQWDDFLLDDRVSCFIDLTESPPTMEHVDMLFRLIKHSPGKTFHLSFSTNTPAGSPFFPTARFELEGFSVGLQAANLAGRGSIQEWRQRMINVWAGVENCFSSYGDYLGIDSSMTSLGSGEGSLVHHATRFQNSFQRSWLTSFYVDLTEFLSTRNPRPTGLCGLMLPCLEDFELAREYEAGNFEVADNLYLSMHSGLGIDTYPIGVDEDPHTILDILQLSRALSLKHQKCISVRFISDGRARIGDRTHFQNKYLKDVLVRPLAGERSH